MRAVDDSRVDRLLISAGSSIARVLDDRQRHAVALALEVCSYIVAALPDDEELKLVDVVRLLRRFGEGFKEADGGDN
jgi:hypothetical protein